MKSRIQGEGLTSTSGAKEKLFVFSARNGLDNRGPGVDAVFEKGGMFYSLESFLNNPTPSNCAASANPLECNGQNPVTFDNVLLIGAYTKAKDSAGNNLLAHYSNFGKTVEIAAPTDLLAPNAYVSEDELGLGIGKIGTHYDDAFNGTSAAAPVVTGVASLVFAVDPKFTASDVKRILIKSAEIGGRYIRNRACAGSGCNNVALETPIPVLNAEEAIKLAKEVSEGREVFVSSQLANFATGKVLIRPKAGNAELVSATGSISASTGPSNSATFSAALTLEPPGSTVQPRLPPQLPMKSTV